MANTILKSELKKNSQIHFKILSIVIVGITLVIINFVSLFLTPSSEGILRWVGIIFWVVSNNFYRIQKS